MNITDKTNDAKNIISEVECYNEVIINYKDTTRRYGDNCKELQRQYEDYLHNFKIKAHSFHGTILTYILNYFLDNNINEVDISDEDVCVTCNCQKTVIDFVRFINNREKYTLKYIPHANPNDRRVSFDIEEDYCLEHRFNVLDSNNVLIAVFKKITDKTEKKDFTDTQCEKYFKHIRCRGTYRNDRNANTIYDKNILICDICQHRVDRYG